MGTIWRNIETGYGTFETKYRLWPSGPPTPDHGHDHQVAGSDRGYVLSFDLSGPHTGDNDGNFWVLHAVETGHTQFGFTRLMKDKSSPTITRAIDSILLELKHAGPDPLPVVRLLLETHHVPLGLYGEVPRRTQNVETSSRI